MFKLIRDIAAMFGLIVAIFTTFLVATQKEIEKEFEELEADKGK